VRCPFETLTFLVTDHRFQQSGARCCLINPKQAALLPGEHEAPLAAGVIPPNVRFYEDWFVKA
jgi:hypothetical protein